MADVLQPYDSASSSNHSKNMGGDSVSPLKGEQYPTGPPSGSAVPRRAFSTTDQPVTPMLPPTRTAERISALHTPAGAAAVQARAAAKAASGHHFGGPGPAAGPGSGAAARPAMVLAAPQRSYSVMDFVPVPLTHQPGTHLTLGDLPAELHFVIYGFLDPIDSTCLGLTSRQFYAVHRALHGTVSLATQREGPNDMEWVWRHAGPFVVQQQQQQQQQQQEGQQQNSLATLTPRGQVWCRKCRTARCELHNHIREWFEADGGDRVEYCAVSHKFGRPAPEGARPACSRSSPRHPHRCGRHTRQQRQVRLT